MQLKSAKFIAFAFLVWVGCASDLHAQGTTTPKPVTLLPPGVKYPSMGTESGSWNRPILLSRSKIVSGDVAKLSGTARDIASAFSLTILATVTPPAGTNAGYVLSDVGVGYTVPISGTPVVVTDSTASELGAGIGFFARQVLASSLSELAKVKTIVHTTTLLVFDAPSIMLRQGKHKKLITRHMIWIDPQTGSGATIVWLLGNNAAGKLTPVNEPLRLFPHGTVENKRIHIDGNEFSMFGFPTEKTFALEDLPPGKKVAWTRELAAVASLPKYSADQVTELSQRMNAAIVAAQAVESSAK